MKLGKRRAVSAALTLAMVVGCVSGGGVADAAKKASLKTKSMTLDVKKSKKIAIKNKSAKKKYTFKSNKTSIAKVSSAGKVTGVKAGKAKITVYEADKKKAKKKTKIGTCSVVVKAKSDDKQKNTPVPSSNPAASATPAASAPGVTAPPVQQTETPTQAPAETPEAKPTIVPAYSTTVVDFDGSTSKVVESEVKIPLTTAMQYGGLCKVTAEFSQDTGSEQELTVGYEGEYLYFKQSGAYIDKNSMSTEPIEDAQTFSCPSGQAVSQEFTFEVPKYSSDFNLKLSAAQGVSFKVDNVTVQTMPYEDADYAGMVANSTLSTGNNARIKKAIEKARAGEDVTIAYLGGSITEGFAASETDNGDCYAETSYKQFKYNYGAGDGSNVHFINAGMSGTPSRLGIVRYERDVLAQMKNGEYPDILFIDFAVNDGGDCRETYESIIRTALEHGSAVVLMFVLYISGCAHEKDYSEFGKYYDLAMVSPGQGMSSSNKSLFDKWFYWSDGHPDVGGHRYMADCISNMFRTIDEEDTEEDNITDIRNMAPKDGKNFVGMKTLESSTEVGGAVKSVDPGSFSVLTDASQPTLQYKKNGIDGMQWFPDVWAHTSTSGSESFTAEITCNSILVAYKQSGANTFGVAQCYVDGEYVGDLKNSTGGWNNAVVFTALSDDKVKDHTLEIKMKEGDENKPFTIYAIGYSESGEKSE